MTRPPRDASMDDWQDRVLRGVRGTATDRGPDHIDVQLADSAAFARLDDAGRVRLSLFLTDVDTPESELHDRMGLLPRPTAGIVDVVESDEGTVLRLLTVLDCDDALHDRCARAAREADLLRGVARNGANAWDMPMTLGGAGVVVPPQGDVDEIAALAPWHWANITVEPMDLYLFDLGTVLGAGLASPTFSLCHFGHGMNSYGLTLLVTCGPVAAFVQHGYGGAFMDRLGSLDAIARTYNRLRVMFANLGEEPTGPPQWLLTFSTFRGECSLVQLEHERGVSRVVTSEPVADEDALFDKVYERLQSSSAEWSPSAEAHRRRQMPEPPVDDALLEISPSSQRGYVILAGEGEDIHAYDDPDNGIYLLMGGGSIELPDGEIVGGSWTRSFSRADERERFLQERYGEALRRYREYEVKRVRRHGDAALGQEDQSSGPDGVPVNGDQPARGRGRRQRHVPDDESDLRLLLAMIRAFAEHEESTGRPVAVKVLREALYFHWEKPRLPPPGKYSPQLLHSAAARAQCDTGHRGGLVFEHAYPINLLVRELLSDPPTSTVDLRHRIEEHSDRVVITKQENAALSAARLANSRPDQNDRWSRYRAVGIDPDQFAPWQPPAP